MAGMAAASFEPARAQQDFVAANELALKGDLKSAIALYRTLVDQGVSNEDLFYNLGNAYAEDGQLAEAAVAYERALRLQPNDRDARANLAALRKQMGASDKLATPAGGEEQVALADLVEPIVAPLPLGAFAWAAVVLEAVLFACLLWRRRAADGVRRKLSLVAAFSLVLFLFAGTVVAGHYVLARDPRAVVVVAGEMKEGPHPRFKNAGQVRAGARVRVLSEDSGFAHVLKDDGSSGWVPVKSLVRV
jgi:hypothetical protein